ncbi:MAG: polysaccharide biosynthesis C-terminal domain-containing protein [Chthoniobacterales bacterium]
MRHIADLAKGSLIYFLGSAANAVLPLLLLPILTRPEPPYLTVGDSGIVTIASDVLLPIIIVVTGFNAYGLLARNFFDKDETKLSQLLSVSCILAAVISFFLLIVCWFAQAPLAQFFEFPARWFPAVIFLSFATVIQNNYLALLQARKEPFRFIANQTISNIINIGFSLWLLIGFDMHWQGRIWALIAAMTSVLLISLWGLHGRLHLLKFTFHWDALKELLAFGVPLIPHVAGGLIMAVSARFFLNRMVSIDETGLFGIAYRFTTPIAMVVGAANKAYLPALFEILSHEKTLNKFSLCRWLILAGLGLVIGGFIYALVIKAILPIFVGVSFLKAGNYLVWLSLTMSFQGLYFIFSNLVIYSKKTHLLSWRADFLGAIAMLALCPLLIHFIGAVGAAVATMLATLVSTIGCIWAAKRAYPMPWGKAIASLIFPFQKNT